MRKECKVCEHPDHCGVMEDYGFPCLHHGMPRWVWDDMKRKHQNEFDHFKQRMLERYGVEVDFNDYLYLNLAIEAGEGKLLDKENDDQWIYEVDFGRDHVTIQVVWSNKRRKITTALPPGAWRSR